MEIYGREQILVVVAINHVWALIADVRKGSMGTLVDHGGAEPKWNVNSFWHFESGEYNVLLFFVLFSDVG